MADNPVSLDMKNLLVAANIGTFGANTSGWSIFIGREPDSPANSITIYDTAGDAPNPKWLLDFPHFQMRVRSLDYPAAQLKSEDIKSALLGLPSQDINGLRYIGIYITTDVFFLKADEKGRSIFITMYRVIREPNTGTNRDPL